MRLKDKQALTDWDEYKKQVEKSTFIDLTETPEQQRKRIEMLEADPEKWFKYYFPEFAYAEPAQFHKDATKRILNNKRWYEVRAWSRELAKSTRTMMEVLYMVLTGRRFNVLMISNSQDNAERLLKPYKINLEANQRIIQDYGEQQCYGSWESTEFVTKKGCAFRGIGAGQNPRGSREGARRIDVVLIDDFDTDVDCKNPKIIQANWLWLEQAVMPTVSISGEYTFIFCGNIIGKDCCIIRAKAKAKHFEAINIRDKNGKSSWPQKNSEQDVDDILALISYISQQKEFYNNPITEGTVFKQMQYKSLPSLSRYKFLVCYIDLSYKSTVKNDFKAAVLMGRLKDEYHIRKCWLKQGTTLELAKGLVEIKNFVNGACPIYWIAEENFLQDLILKELNAHFTSLQSTISITGDSRKKADKFTRIETALQPLDANGKLWLDEDERTNKYMQTLDEQFLALEPGSKAHDDGPDAAEGAKQIIDSKFYEDVPIVVGARKPSLKRY